MSDSLGIKLVESSKEFANSIDVFDAHARTVAIHGYDAACVLSTGRVSSIIKRDAPAMFSAFSPLLGTDSLWLKRIVSAPQHFTPISCPFNGLKIELVLDVVLGSACIAILYNEFLGQGYGVLTRKRLGQRGLAWSQQTKREDCGDDFLHGPKNAFVA